ncbi:cyclophilin-like protein [Ganoderma leucocontextum]|nr:cyclophilin-like protein [Ganoderma leucocontextum]
MALPTKGRVIVETTVGEIDIELWSKETPKACRNFIALAMEGYYDGVIFHRVVPDFLVQTGDRTGTGGGGESFFGEPFEDEIHPRLRFVHRGLVGMANNGTKDSNDSQFFMTLNRADELNGKHTLFGRIVGDTFFNVLKIGEMELDDNERPLYPPKVKRVRIVDNPFEDIVPRITAEEKRAQQRAREQAQREREEEQRRRGAKKDVKLLSFGGDEEAEEELVVFKKKPIVRPDLIDNPDLPSTIPGVPEPPTSKKSSKRDRAADSGVPLVEKKSSKREKDESDITKIREQHEREKAAASDSRKSEIERMEAEIRKLTRRKGEGSDDDEPEKKKPKKSYLEEEMAKYEKGRGLKKKGKGRKDEGDVLAALNSFRSKLKNTTLEDSLPPEQEGDEDNEDEPANNGEEEEGMEVDDDVGFLGHLLHFPKGNEEETAKAEREYEVIDPRQRGARAREEERERKRALKAKDVTGGRGSRR